MIDRRRIPEEIISDNGTNFLGANKELFEITGKLVKDKNLKSLVIRKCIKWTFNPPYAPHFGGVFETMIKAATRAVMAILGNVDVTDEEIMTAFTGAEALINSRSLTYQAATRAVMAILGNVDVTDEELMTAFTGAEALINSRSLTYQSADPEDDIPLTPNH